MLGRSGTQGHGRTGTGGSDHREPESTLSSWNFKAFVRLNSANRESFGSLLTQPRLCVAGGGLPAPPRQKDRSGEGPLTHVTLLWREGEHEDWLRFGKPVAGRIIDRTRRIESYAAGQVFALVRWASNDYGTVRSTLDIVRAVGRGEAFTTLPQVDPGGELLLAARGWARVRAALLAIDAIEVAGYDTCLIAPDHWRHIGNRLACGMLPRAYDDRRHRAWLARRRLQP
ncbi:MAG TPA: DUF2840 domain-containing protein [Erythrobacter sp.]|nr:DUF2840 domain-containing protein [Erythrobacter sp.]